MERKKLIVALMALMPVAMMAQNHRDLLSDSAMHVVDRYVKMLDIDHLPTDSMLVMETAVTTNLNTKDTIWMRRWFAAGERHRIEVWNDQKMDYGLSSNGKDRFRTYRTAYESWESINSEEFNKKLQGYDFRGPLYRWNEKGAQLSWNGTTELKGQPLQVVKVVCPNMYTRYYMFEPDGLLAIIIETDEMEGKRNEQSEKLRIEWKCMHEYLSVGSTVLPRLESFLRNGELTVLETKARLEPRRDIIFNSDRP